MGSIRCAIFLINQIGIGEKLRDFFVCVSDPIRRNLFPCIERKHLKMIPYEKRNQAFVATGGATDVKSVIANFESLSVRQNRTAFSHQDVGGDKQIHILDEKKKLEKTIDSRSTEACVERNEEAKREESEPLILYDGVIDDQLDEKNLPAVEPHYPSKEVLKNNLQGMIDREKKLKRFKNLYRRRRDRRAAAAAKLAEEKARQKAREEAYKKSQDFVEEHKSLNIFERIARALRITDSIITEKFGNVGKKVQLDESWDVADDSHEPQQPSWVEFVDCVALTFVA